MTVNNLSADGPEFRGAIDVCGIRGGEWMRYTVEVPKSGTYEVAARVSSPYSPAGRFTLTFDGARTTAPVDVRTTTSHDACRAIVEIT